MKILLLGQGPLPPEGEANRAGRLSAPSIRAWHIARALQEEGHEIALVSLKAGSTDFSSPRALAPNLQLYSIGEAAVTGQAALSRLEKEFQPAAAVAVSAWPSYLAALYLAPSLPFWADFFGSPLAEGQAKAFQAGDDTLLEPFARFERVVLRRADAVSAVSPYQEHALVGALATHGRLNHFTDGFRLAYTIPATLDPARLPASDEPFLRGKVVPNDAFVVLWSGGFNTWTDIDTLYSGVSQAMQANPRLHFVATGGSLPPHDSQTFPRFQKMVEASEFKERFHLLGWVPYEGLHNYYLESDVGLILDRWSYEGILGSRTRLLDWLLYGLPAVVTVTAYLTEELVGEGLAFSFPHGSASDLAARLRELAEDPARLTTAAARSKTFVAERYSYEVACRPLLEWVVNPRQAPDAGQTLPSFAVARNNNDRDRLLAEYEAQIEAKNKALASMESWAKEMETRLRKANPPSLYTRISRHFRH
jgi:glycosyltransferase involved in cell wall biosynthesis